jgi:predicted O-linked N-acetylglucosamine transferase (SPINDLY family)
VTLVGQIAAGRAGWSQLSNLGLAELAADTPERFIDIAADLARDLPRLKDLRVTLRQRMQNSPLMDAPRFARSIESAYRTMWHRWCDR